jgi:hypothetical protein
VYNSPTLRTSEFDMAFVQAMELLGSTGGMNCSEKNLAKYQSEYHKSHMK